MIVDRMRSDERDGAVRRSARVRWDGGEHRLHVTLPAELAARRADASPYLSTTLLLAMRLGEDLELDGPVSPPLMERAPRIVDLYAQWDPRLYRSRVRAAAALEPASRAPGIASFISRGVDSLYSACVPRGLPGPLTQLVFCDGLEPLHSPETRAEELRLAGEAAAAVGLPMAVIESNVRELTNPIVLDWEDMAGGTLAFFAGSLAGGLGHVVIPSSDGPTTIGPCGTSPLLDPLFSTAEVQVEHDTPQTRVAKVEWLCRERPEVLPYLKVCFYEDRPDNCGRCVKCLLTMLALEAAGGRSRATGFPELDPAELEKLNSVALNERIEFEAVRRGLIDRGAGDELVDAVGRLLERGAARDPAGIGLTESSPDFRRRAWRRARLVGRTAAAEPPARVRRASGRPRATVMMPAYRAEATLREAVDSVLAQTVGDLELIVVDDGSPTPVAADLAGVSDPRLRVIRHDRNRGLSAARNTALAAARAPLVSQLDADDRWESDYLAAVLPRFEDQGVGLVYTNATILGHPQGHLDYIGDPSVHPMDAFPKIAEQNPIPSCTATMRTHAVREAGGYARWLRQCEDYHLYMRLARAGWRFDYVHRRLAGYRWPSPERGMSYDRRRHELWELAMFASMLARHPLTPGPRRQVRTRLRREVEQARAIRRRGLPEPHGERPRVLVDPGSHAVLNLGDIAMLQVCVERLRRLVPHASIQVVTAAPERLARHCPGVVPIPAAGLYEWFDAPWSGGPWSPLLPESARARLRVGTRVAERAGPRAARAALRAELAAREPVSDDARAFLAALLGADAFVISGRGGTTDAFPQDSLRMLEALRLASALGATTAMMSQGLGPASDPALRERAADVLPRLDLVAARDRLTSLAVLDAAGVDRARVVVSGDDALAPAHARAGRYESATGLGVGLRVSGYSDFGDGAVDALGRAVASAAARHGGELVPIPISRYPHEADSDALAALTGDGGAGVDTPAAAIDQASACRVVVTGSYHAAVFALAQGIPVVGVTSSAYYGGKLEGLADLFRGGCTIVPAGAPDAEQRIGAAVDAAWETADVVRGELLAAAESQIAAAESAYARLAAALGGSAAGGPQVTSNDSMSASDTRPAVRAVN